MRSHAGASRAHDGTASALGASHTMALVRLTAAHRDHQIQSALRTVPAAVRLDRYAEVGVESAAASRCARILR